MKKGWCFFFFQIDLTNPSSQSVSCVKSLKFFANDDNSWDYLTDTLGGNYSYILTDLKALQILPLLTNQLNKLPDHVCNNLPTSLQNMFLNKIQLPESNL